MSWFAELAGKAETLLNNLDEQTGVALRNHNVSKPRKNHKNEHNILQNEPSWSHKKRPIPRSLKKITPITETRSSYIPNRKSSPPPAAVGYTANKDDTVQARNSSPKPKKPVSRKSSPQYTLERCPNTLVADVKDDIVNIQDGSKQRRLSLPVDLKVAGDNEWEYNIQNLMVENAMLTNERNAMDKEMRELIERLCKTEDGNDVDNVVSSSTDLMKNNMKLQNFEVDNFRISLDNENLAAQLAQLKQRINDLTEIDIVKYKEANQSLETQVSILKENCKELEQRLEEQSEKLKCKDIAHSKLETELRHAQANIGELHTNLEKSTIECHRLEKDWETYKLRVKSMLHVKDNEIKELKQGLNVAKDTKLLIEQIENLKVERAELSEIVSQVQNECSNMKQQIEQLEAQHSTAERIIGALRDALKEERAARNRVESHCATLGKELKSVQIDTGQTIASLRTALRDKELELNQLRDTASTVRSADTSALNVADYGVTQDSIDAEKIHHLTETLVQRQAKIDSLLADNNILRIQLEKLESKYKTEVAAIRANYPHSVVSLQDGEVRCRSRNYVPESTMSALSMRMGIFMKRYPIFRIFILVYMIGLHFWVLTVLFTSTPEDHVTRLNKS